MEALRTRRGRIIALLSALVFMGITVVLATAIGPVWIPPIEVFGILLNAIPGLDALIADTWSPAFETIIIHIRLPRVILGVLVGAALAVAGTGMQGLFRNPMASPYVIGISSGAALGASIAILFALAAFMLPLFAFIGALATALLVSSLARTGSRTPIEKLLLVGIAVSSFLTAIISFLQYISGEMLHGIVFWIMGGLWSSTWADVFVIAPIIIIGIIAMMVFARDLNVMLLGEEPAQHLGINPEAVKHVILAVTSLITGAAVAVSGIIGFVGLIIPHIMRILIGPDHRALIPLSAVAGGVFLVWMDTIARTSAAPVEIPVGVITALAGAPFFIYLIRRSTKTWM